MPAPKRRRFQIRQRRIRRRKNVSFTKFSGDEKKALRFQKLLQKAPTVTARPLWMIQFEHNVDFREIIGKLRKIFSEEKLKILDEGSGESALYKELLDP